ncbi:CheC-like family [Candidatus Moduliflexus flocculans]|uniref:CheC-like family n=1 Tax=Candidatus Moduliflexus flocculans TaxID=1499966 RepID=A0A081BM87_9BACT|nr:CheC-like family [Candidatus Moduliflexus flocculans]
MNLTPYQIDALTELINIGVGKAAGMLNQILEAHVNLQVPAIKIFPYTEIRNVLHEIVSTSLSVVKLAFKGPFSGTALLAFPPDSASNLVNLLTGELSEHAEDFDSIRVGALTEVGNIVLNGVMGSLSNILQEHLSYSIPDYVEDSIERLLLENNADADSTIILAQTELVIEQLEIHGNVLLLFRVGLFNALAKTLESL